MVDISDSAEIDWLMFENKVFIWSCVSSKLAPGRVGVVGGKSNIKVNSVSVATAIANWAWQLKNKSFVNLSADIS